MAQRSKTLDLGSKIPSFLVVGLCLLAAYRVHGACDNGWISSGLFCYYFSTDVTTQPLAEQACQTKFASLAFIDDNGENNFLYDEGPGKTFLSYWIGYVRVVGVIWRWNATGSAGAYRKWDIGEPDGEGSCARITPYIQGVWRDWECSRTLPYICKKYADCGVSKTLPLSTITYTPDVGPVTAASRFPRDAVAAYQCVQGAEYRDGSTVKNSVCSIGGVWYPDLSNDPCEWKSCPPPPTFDPAESMVITNATATTRDFETVLYYKCTEGYWFDKYSEGQTRYITCQYDKTWTGIERIVECSKKSCVRPVTTNARANTPSNQLGVVATYTCVPGYKFLSDNTTTRDFTCTPTGWNPPPEKCEEMRCPEISVENTYNSTVSRAVFTTLLVRCNPGYSFPDTTTKKALRCLESEQWNRVINEGCIPKKCENLPPNATETYEHDWSPEKVYYFNDSITYTCSIEGWLFSDGFSSRKVVCDAKGEWSPRVVSECLGEKVEIVKDVTHPPAESENATTMGSVGLVIIAVAGIAMVVMDLLTIGKHLKTLKENLCSSKKETAEEEGVNADQKKPSTDATPLKLTDV